MGISTTEIYAREGAIVWQYRLGKVLRVDYRAYMVMVQWYQTVIKSRPMVVVPSHHFPLRGLGSI